MKIRYADKNFRTRTRRTINQVNAIIDEYQDGGMDLTLRQLYYQFVARGLIANNQKEYSKLGRVVSEGRLAGLIDWDVIADRTRSLRGRNQWNNPGEIIDECVTNFHLDYWEGQDYRVEVWIEKEALIGVIQQICRRLDVDYFACRGYVSQSAMWRASQRLVYDDRVPVIIHLGDHDPSGVDMTRDITDRMLTFAYGVERVEVERIALNMDQIDEYDPPPNFAKLSDSRAYDYIKMYGRSSWELDALDPMVLKTLIEEKVKLYRDEELYQNVLEQEREYKEVLAKMAEDWKESNKNG